MTPKEKRKWAKKLRKYWELYHTIHDEYWKNITNLEAMMSNDVGEKLEFFRSDGEVCGIGHSDYNRRNSKKKGYFPLFQAESIGGYW